MPGTSRHYRATILFLVSLGAGFVHAQTTLFTDDFETRDFSAWTGTNQAAPNLANAKCTECGRIVENPVHSGRFALEATMSSSGSVKLMEKVTPVPDLFVRFYFYLDKTLSMQNRSTVTVLSVEEGEQLLLYNSGGAVYLRDRSGHVGTHAVSSQAWHSIEVRSSAANGTGMATVWLDGSVEIDAKNLAFTGPFSVFYLGVDNFGSATGSIFFDDVVASTAPIGSPAAGITARYPNSAARTGMPVDLTIFGEEPGDVLSARMDGAEVFRTSGAVSGHERFQLNLTPLAGDHKLVIQLMGAKGSVKASFSGTIHKYTSGEPTVAIDENNNILVRGRKYFAVAPFEDGLRQWETWRSHKAVNTYGWMAGFADGYRYSRGQYKDFLDSLGGALAIGPNDNFTGRREGVFAANQPDAAKIVGGYVSSLKNHRGVFMWTWKDEPDIGPGVGHVPPAQMRSLLQVTHTNDANHPVLLNVAGYPNSNTRNRRAGWYYPLVPNSTEMPADVYSFDMYPLIYQKGGFTIAQWVDQIDRVQRYTYGLTPWYVFVEAGIQPCPDPPACTKGHGPTAAQVTMESWLAVIHGVKGISWWGPLAYIDDAHYRAMAAFLARISELKDVVLSDTTRKVVSDRNVPHARVDAAVRDDGKSVYLFAARLSELGEEGDPPITARLSVSGLGSSSAEVLGENRSVPVVNGALSDTFMPLAVHIYRIPALATALKNPAAGR